MYPRATRQFASAAVIDSSPDNLQSLPETVEALRALVLATFAERDAAVIERDTLLTQNDRLRHLLLKLGGRPHMGLGQTLQTVVPQARSSSSIIHRMSGRDGDMSDMIPFLQSASIHPASCRTISQEA
jgi:hypothetical protein